MDGSGNVLVSPVSIIPPAISKCSHSPGGLDENELCNDQIAFRNTKSSKKSPSPTKHYMSPTISAASKAALPRKKILGERNGVPDVEHILYAKPFNLSPKILSPRCSNNGPINVKSCSSAPSIVETMMSAKCSTNGLNDVQSSFAEPADESSLKPYDPVTNYLSPRPQFLRYNPNRLHKIFLHTENEDGERGVGFDAIRSLSFDPQKPAFEEALGKDSQESSVSCSKEDFIEEEDEKRDNENAEVDTQESSVFSSEEDNEGSSVLSSEEDPVKEEYEKTSNDNAENYHVNEKVEEEEKELEVFEDERSWSLKGVSQFLLVMVSLIFSTRYISSMNSPRLTDTSVAVWDFKSQHLKYHFETCSNFSEGAIEPAILWGKSEIGLMKFDHGVNDGFEEEFVIRDDKKSLVEITYELYEMEEAETQKEVHEVQVLESRDKASDQVEVMEIENAEEVSSQLQASEEADMYGNENNSGLGYDDENMGRGDEIEPVEEVPDQLVEDDVGVQDTGNNEVDEIDTGNAESGPPSPESDTVEFLLPKAKLDSIQAAVGIVVSIIFTILALLGVYYLRQKKLRIEESCPVVEPLVEPVLTENISPQPPTMEEEKNDGAKVFASSSTLVHEVQEEVVAAADIRHSHLGHSHSHSHSHLSHSHSHSHSHQSHAPSVELLGELVIGEVSSSRRSYTVRSRNSEEERDSVSRSQKGSFVEASEGFSHAKTTSFDLSAADSTTLDGSSIAEKKKKRGKGGAEVTTPIRRSDRKVVLPSPVRRSSRLRAMSP